MHTPRKKMWPRWMAIGALVLAGGRVFQLQSIVPFRVQETAARRGVAELQGRIADARNAILQFRALEKDADRKRGELERLQGEPPASVVMVSFPERLKEHFSHFGLRVGVVRMNANLDEAGLPGYKRIYWSMALPIEKADRNITGLLLAIAELEQKDPGIKVIDFALQRDAEDARMRVANVNVSILVPK